VVFGKTVAGNTVGDVTLPFGRLLPRRQVAHRAEWRDSSVPAADPEHIGRRPADQIKSSKENGPQT
jgi:hypothetical protein